jgi:hypothetical protein
MNPKEAVSPEFLLGQVRDQILIIAEPVDAQVAWCEFNGYPVDEIFLSLDTVAFTHRPRLRHAGLLRTEADAGIDELLAHFETMRSLKKPALWQPEGLGEPEWDAARTLAQQVLRQLSALTPQRESERTMRRWELWEKVEPNGVHATSFFPEDNEQARRMARENGMVFVWEVRAKGINDAMRAEYEYRGLGEYCPMLREDGTPYPEDEDDDYQPPSTPGGTL